PYVRYGGNTSCVAVAHDGDPGPVLLLDAGTGLANATGLLGGAAFAGTILLSHLHWDHCLGLPFFRAGDRADARVRLLIPDQGGPGLDGSGPAERLLSRVMSPPFFPITPAQLRGDWTFGTVSPGQLKAEGFTIEAREIPHKGGRTIGYRVSDGRSVLAYVTDHCPTVLGPGPDGWGEYHPAAVELAAGADVLIHDAQLLPAELAQAAFGHPVADYAVGLARRAGARRVELFHHKPDRTDDELDQLARRFAASPVPVAVAAEGRVLDLPSGG
ncbi:MAG: MBL fold metallo-hydrolase, partial [Streptosporangiaceae bacterium]